MNKINNKKKIKAIHSVSKFDVKIELKNKIQITLFTLFYKILRNNLKFKYYVKSYQKY